MAVRDGLRSLAGGKTRPRHQADGGTVTENAEPAGETREIELRFQHFSREELEWFGRALDQKPRSLHGQ
jgi:hypothetical protein